jgi:hypothetical protein
VKRRQWRVAVAQLYAAARQTAHLSKTSGDLTCCRQRRLPALSVLNWYPSLRDQVCAKRWEIEPGFVSTKQLAPRSSQVSCDTGRCSHVQRPGAFSRRRLPSPSLSSAISLRNVATSSWKQAFPRAFVDRGIERVTCNVSTAPSRDRTVLERVQVVADVIVVLVLHAIGVVLMLLPVVDVVR